MAAMFELHFYRPTVSPLTVDDLELFCGLIGHYKIALDRDAETCRYHHPDTGVRFDMQLLPPATIEGGSKNASSGLRHTGLVARLPLQRATLFGAEAVPILVIFCQRFRTHVWHSGLSPDDAPIMPDQQALMQAWLAANSDALQPADPAKFKWPHEAMASWYRYQLMRAQLEQSMLDGGHEVTVPTMRLVRDSEKQDSVHSMVDWLDGRAQVFPQADLVLIRRPKSRFFGLSSVEVTGWTEFENLRRAIAQGLHKMQTDGGEVFLLGENQAPKMMERLDSVPLNSDMDRFKPITTDDFVDV